MTVLYSSQLADRASKQIRVLAPLRQLRSRYGVETVALEEVSRVEGSSLTIDAEVYGRASSLFLYVLDGNATSGSAVSALLPRAVADGKRIICDLDDHYLIPAPASPFEESLRGQLPALRQVVESAHVLTVTGRHLRDEMRPFHSDVHIVPNTVDPEHYPSRADRGGKLRVGWFGGPTHLDDLALIAPAIRELQTLVPSELVLFGLYDEDMTSTLQAARLLRPDASSEDEHVAAFIRLARALDGIDFRHHPAVPFAEFPRRLAELDFDIGLCPLRDGRFARCKSALKFYQYAVSGTVTLASRVPPYVGECDDLVDNDCEAWTRSLLQAARSHRWRSEALERQRARVLTERVPASTAESYRGLLAPAEVASAVRGRTLETEAAAIGPGV